MRQKFSSIDEYLSHSSEVNCAILKKIRKEIKKRIPSASEVISYNIPAFKDEKVFIYFAGFKNHISIFPPCKDKKLQAKLKPYQNEKGNLIFPLTDEIPIALIGDVAESLWEQHKD